MSGFPDFPSFFHALWGHDPFPWQSMLAERVAESRWPHALDLPTASGKTACIDVALYALAAQFKRPVSDRTAPRRIWFVVDRRIVVDQAFDRAQELALKLEDASDGPLREVAQRLREISGTGRAVALGRLRGGIFRDDGWARLPSQPAIITTTVDQLGSRLLFRGYGRTNLTASIFAGLAANDSLVLLDEAHCSVPFLQTLRAIEVYRGARWAEAPLRTPFAPVVLSATPPADIPADAIFPGTLREDALDHPVLRARLEASKPAALVEVKTKVKKADDPLVIEMVDRVIGLIRDKRIRVAAMVNRVRTAEAVAQSLREQIGETTDVLLLTGRMRPFDRDSLVESWKPYLRASEPQNPNRPIALVSTQCLEVGADFSFDALVTEAASLDALRQRFGRLDRMGTARTSAAAILIRDRDIDRENAESDQIYGAALAASWAMLKSHAEGDLIDFGVEPLRRKLLDVEDFSPFLAPVLDAPVLLPAHLDLLCQTSPPPHPDPDVHLFLHGRGRAAPEVKVVWRADLLAAQPSTWIEVIALCPPVGSEMLAAPLNRLRAFLGCVIQADESSDVEGLLVVQTDEEANAFRPCLIWRGRDRSKVAEAPGDIRPNDVVVLPAAYGLRPLGQPSSERGCGVEGLDLWERALESAGRPYAVRLSRPVLAEWLGCPPVAALADLAESPDVEHDAIADAIDCVLTYEPRDDGDPAAPPGWWREILRAVRHSRCRVDEHPIGGVILGVTRPSKNLQYSEADLFADDDDLTSASGHEVPLAEHCELVARTAAKLATHCVPDAYLDAIQLAAYWHDAGKLDERFQTLLRNGDELAVAADPTPLAKSASVAISPARRAALREASGLPLDFRHEMLSMQLAERYASRLERQERTDLCLHLIASHHGHARPLAPISSDLDPPPVIGRFKWGSVDLRAEERSGLPPPHRVDSGLADRFWRLVRRHGWWGLAYLEALIRLSDWYASRLKPKDTNVEASAV